MATCTTYLICSAKFEPARVDFINMFSIIIYIMVFNHIAVFISATSLEEEKQKYSELLLECAREYPVTASDIDQLQRKEMPQSYAVKCLFACTYKRSGMMDDQGYLSVEGVHAISREVFADDQAKMEKAIEFTEACKSVNDVAVSDGTQGCERAALIFQCSVEKAPQFDIGY